MCQRLNIYIKKWKCEISDNYRGVTGGSDNMTQKGCCYSEILDHNI